MSAESAADAEAVPDAAENGGAGAAAGHDDTKGSAEAASAAASSAVAPAAATQVVPRRKPKVAVTPPAGPPRGVSVSLACRGIALVRWRAPHHTVVSHYSVRCDPRPEGSDVAASSASDDASVEAGQAPGSARSWLLRGLTGPRYTISVAAVNDKGTGPASDPVEVVPVLIPGAPPIGSAKRGAGPGTAVVTFGTAAAPAGAGSQPVSPITSYHVRSVPPRGFVTVFAEDREATVANLDPGTEYRFVVHAMCEAGPGPESEPSNAVLAFGPPRAPTAVISRKVNSTDAATPPSDGAGAAASGGASPGVAGAGKGAAEPAVNVTWSASSGSGGSKLVSYQVRCAAANGCSCDPDADPVTVGPDQLSAQVRGLELGTAHTFVVTATNADGYTSSPSTPSRPVTMYQAPSESVRAIKATPGTQVMALDFLPPRPSKGDAPTSAYDITLIHVSCSDDDCKIPSCIGAKGTKRFAGDDGGGGNDGSSGSGSGGGSVDGAAVAASSNTGDKNGADGDASGSSSGSSGAGAGASDGSAATDAGGGKAGSTGEAEAKGDEGASKADADKAKSNQGASKSTAKGKAGKNRARRGKVPTLTAADVHESAVRRERARANPGVSPLQGVRLFLGNATDNCEYQASVAPVGEGGFVGPMSEPVRVVPGEIGRTLFELRCEHDAHLILHREFGCTSIDDLSKLDEGALMDGGITKRDAATIMGIAPSKASKAINAVQSRVPFTLIAIVVAVVGALAYWMWVGDGVAVVSGWWAGVVSLLGGAGDDGGVDTTVDATAEPGVAGTLLEDAAAQQAPALDPDEPEFPPDEEL